MICHPTIFISEANYDDFVTAARQFMRKVIFRYPPMILLRPVHVTTLHYIELGQEFRVGLPAIQYTDTAAPANEAEDAKGADDIKAAEFAAIDENGNNDHVAEAWTLKDVEKGILDAIEAQTKTTKPKKGLLRRFTNIFRKHIPRKASKVYNDLRSIFQ